ncbi:MAG: DedA family protein [Longicatena sp.]
MQTTLLSFMSSYGYWAIAFLIAIENIFPPIPSEVILTFGGFMTTYTDMHILYVIIYATVGSLIGAIILYGVGRLVSVERLSRLAEGKVGTVLHFKVDDIEKARLWFEKRGYITVFFCRFIPIVRSLISIPAGLAKMNFFSFLMLTTLGTLIWNSVLVYAGAYAGASWEKIADYMGTFSSIVLIVLLIICLVGAYLLYKRKKANKS